MPPFHIHAPRVVVADDQSDVLEALRLLLKGEGFVVEAVDSPERLLDVVGTRDFDAALIDLNYARDTTSGQEGLDLLSSLASLDATFPVIVMTAWGTIDLAVEAMRRGARDFIQKPWDNARLLNILRTQIDLRRALRRGERLEAENRLLREESPVRMIAESAAMKPVMQVMERIAPSDANVLITGENGTGKGVVTHTVHALSARSTRPLVTVNIGGFSENLFESELFGHVKGAFTDARTDRVGRFEMADSGTLFLDEIANIPPNLQAKLLRVLETGEFERVGSSKTLSVDARIISATNADLHSDVASGRFRQDLFFRLNTIEIHLPPLRDRREDIPLLAMSFLGSHGRKYRKEITGFEPSALEAMLSYPWPGNIRELDHMVERGVLMATGGKITPSDLSLRSSRDGAPRLEEMSLEEVEEYLIRRTLDRFDGNVSRAAAALGLSRSAFYRRLAKYEV